MQSASGKNVLPTTPPWTVRLLSLSYINIYIPSTQAPGQSRKVCTVYGVVHTSCTYITASRDEVPPPGLSTPHLSDLLSDVMGASKAILLYVYLITYCRYLCTRFPSFYTVRDASRHRCHRPSFPLRMKQ